MNILGVVPEDAHVKKAVSRQLPFYSAFPHSAAARRIDELLNRYVSGNSDAPQPARTGIYAETEGAFVETLNMHDNNRAMNDSFEKQGADL